MHLRYLIQLFLFPLPWAIRRRALSFLFTMSLPASCRIGLSFLDAKQVTLGEGARIGHLNVIKGLWALEIGAHGRLGNGNWVTGWRGATPHFDLETARASVLKIGDHSAITNRHLIDCTDAVIVGTFTTFAGWGSQILTHAIDLTACRQSCAPVHIGDYCFIGTRVVIQKGSRFPNKSVLGPGSVLHGEKVTEGWLYGGVPARPIKAIGEDGGYFVRDTGFVK